MSIRRVLPLLLVAVVTLAGCGKHAAAPPGPLTVEEWKTMPVDRKYTAETFERLKEGDPKLQTDAGWRTFSRTILLPTRQRDLPRRTR